MSNDFLPDNTEIPKGESNYMRLTEPENKFRVLGSAVTGYELWVNGKPKRNKDKDSFTSQELLNADINKFTGKQKTPQYFWAFPVFNYQTNKIEILELTQVTVMRGIKDYLDDSDYGDPKQYDFNIIRDDSGEKVEYRVKAKPPKKLDDGVLAMYKGMDIDLTALYRGEDPFSTTSSSEKIADDVEAGLNS